MNIRFFVEQRFIGRPGFLPHYSQTVEQHQFGDIAGWRRGINLTAETIVNQLWNPADMIKMSVGDEKSVNLGRSVRKRFAVLVFNDFSPLK